MSQEITIQSLDPTTFEYQTYSNADSQLIVQSLLDTVFSKDTDYIEYYIYDLNKTLIFPDETYPLLDYDIRQGDVILTPAENLENFNFELGTYNILYNFFRKRLSSNTSQKYFISDISSDRTEIRLDSNIISNDLIISSSNDFIQYREDADYFVDFYLNFGLNQTVIANNIKLETEQGIDPTILIKLYEPLPSNFSLKDELWVVEELSLPQAYEVNFPFVPIIEDDFTFIQGPNYNLNLIQETSAGGELFSFDTLLQSDVTSSINQIQNLLSQKEVNININYEKYGNFVNFSSAKTRLENFYYKVGLIEFASNQITSLLDPISSGTTTTTSYSSSRAVFTGQIDTIIKNFDGYEYFLYFNSGSQHSYPKQNTQPPFQLYPTGSTEVLNWIGSAGVSNPYYGGQALSASDYDQNNRDWLYWSIPEYLRDDPANQGYELFVDMVAQYYDNVWTYTKDISNKFDADNRLEYGISKDLVADAIRDFGVKLYSSNFNTNDLFTAFLGLTPSGSAFPFPEMTGSVVDGSGDLAIPSGYEYVDTKISASNDIVPLNDVQKQVYKRVYHNIPYLLKTKGTVAGIRALITSYGIPDTILRISEFGGKDRNESQDYDLKQNVFNYAFDTGASSTNFVSSSLQANTKFPVQIGNNKARTIQLRFKPAEIPLPTNNVASGNIRYSQSIFSTDDSGGNLVLEYNGAGLISGSYSGSIASPYDTYGTLKWIPAEGDNPDLSASVYLPFFNGDWWSVQMNVDNSVDASLYAANEIDGKIGFNESSSTVGFDDSYYFDATIGYLNKSTNVVFDDGTTYTPFSGSFQELRYYVNEISQSHFYDYAVNPYSNEGNGINSTPNQQFFRAALGTQLDTGSRTSIHPRVTGSAVQITQSFATDSEFYINSPKFITNVEDIFQDQVPAGIKNRVTNKIQLENLILAEAPYGYQTPTSSVATISSTNNDTTTLSALESIQQQSFVSQSYTPSVNYLEVAFSPANQINDDINAQLGYFNLGDYIGDPRFISSSDYSYPNLNRLRDSYFEKYIKGYDVVDFVRLIKFFDNSLFKMIKDFTPARTSLASGVVVKQHLLERNRQRPAQATSSLHDYEGLVVNLPKDYSSGSTDFPQYSTQGSAIYKFTGGTGGSFERFNGLSTYPSGSKGLGPDNRFNLTQSWSESADYSIINGVNFNQSNSFFISASGGAGKYPGRSVFDHSDQSEFYDGIFSGSNVSVFVQPLNPGCEPYLRVSDTPINYRVLFYSYTDAIQGSVTRQSFLQNTNAPLPGEAWIASSRDTDGNSTVKDIKLASVDLNGNQVGDYLLQDQTIEIIYPDASLPNGRTSTEYFIEGVINNGNNVALNIADSLDNYITGSINGGSDDFTLVDAKGTFFNYGGTDNNSQGAFLNPSVNVMSQNIYFWGDMSLSPITPFIDTQVYFNPGANNVNTDDILSDVTNFSNGSYSLGMTPNIPLFFSCSIAYSASQLGIAGEPITSSGIYHSASNNQGNVYQQTFTLDDVTGLESGVYTPAPAIETVSTEVSFYTGYNNLIPGNSASWYNDGPFATNPQSGIKPDSDNLAGHPQLINLGTSSFDWYFPKFTFQHTTPAPANPTTSPTSFSGSSVPGSSTNDPFWYVIPTSGMIGSSGDVDITTRQNYDGAVGITKEAFVKYFEYLYNFGGGAGQFNVSSNPPWTFLPTIQIQVLMYYTVEATTGDDFGCGGFVQSATGSSFNNAIDEDGLNEFSTFASLPSAGAVGSRGWFSKAVESSGTTTSNLTYEDGNTGFWRVTQSFSNVQFTRPTLFDNDNANRRERLWFKPYIQGLDADTIDYKISDLRIVVNSPVSNDNFNSTLPLITDTVLGITGFSLWQETPSNNNHNFFEDGLQSTSLSSNPTSNDVNLLNSLLLTRPWDVFVQPFLMKLSASQADFDGNANASGPFPDWLDAPVVGKPIVIATGSAVKLEAKIGTGQPQTEIVDFSGKFGTDPVFKLNIISADYTGNDNGRLGYTINEPGDIYYVEYSMSRFNSRLNNANKNIPISFPLGINDTGSRIIISQSVNDIVEDASISASIYVTQGSISDPTLIGTTIVNELAFTSNDERATGRVAITGSINIEANNYTVDDAFRMGVSVEKSFGYGLTITEYSMSIFNSSSRWSPFNDATRMSNNNLNLEANNYREPLSTPFIIQTYYGNGILPFQYALDCQPLLNNFVNQRPNPYLMDIDYNFQGNTIYFSSSIAPVNFLQILSGSAVRATVPESNYTQQSFINPRYNGVKSTSKELNVWSIGDTGTYGKNPTVELRDAYFGYFNDLDDPYPNINGLTRVNLNYLIDEQGNALPPSIQPITIDTFKAVFPTTTLGKIAAKSGKNQYKTLGDPAPIERIMEYVSPVIYSQNSSNNYTNSIPLSGSGYISRYDNDDENSIQFGRFTALGTASIDTTLPQQTVEYYLDPSEALTLPSQNENINVWAAGNSQSAYYDDNDWDGSIGDELGNEQIISMQTSIVTTYVSETKGVRDELKFEIHMETGSQDPSTEVTFNLEDITAKVTTTNGTVTNIGSVLGYSWFNFQNIVTYERRKRRGVNGWNGFGFNRWRYTYVPIPTGGIVCTVDWEMYNTLIDLGIYRDKVHTEIAAIEWIITANSGAYTIKVGDAINWRIKGAFKNGTRSREPQGMFFPSTYQGSYTPVNIQGQGANDYLLAEANTAQAPFWVRSSTSNDSLNNGPLSSSVLIMSSSNMNEAYGTTFRQGDMEYYPGPSQYFPGGVEPRGTNFDPIRYTISLQEGDEIRFGNNENFAYRILEVFAPSENIVGGVGRLKIVVNGIVPTSVNGDFFLVRRPVVNPNSLYLDQPFPYATLSSASIGTFITAPGASASFAQTGSASIGQTGSDGSYTASYSDLEIATTPGILYPDFPTEYLIQSASSIVNDLISKGIIES